jgi:hypothetical protein
MGHDRLASPGLTSSPSSSHTRSSVGCASQRSAQHGCVLTSEVMALCAVLIMMDENLERTTGETE